MTHICFTLCHLPYNLAGQLSNIPPDQQVIDQPRLPHPDSPGYNRFPTTQFSSNGLESDLVENLDIVVFDGNV